MVTTSFWIMKIKQKRSHKKVGHVQGHALFCEAFRFLFRYLLANTYGHAFVLYVSAEFWNPSGQGSVFLMEGQGQMNLSCTDMGGQYSGASFILP